MSSPRQTRHYILPTLSYNFTSRIYYARLIVYIHFRTINVKLFYSQDDVEDMKMARREGLIYSRISSSIIYIVCNIEPYSYHKEIVAL